MTTISVKNPITWLLESHIFAEKDTADLLILLQTAVNDLGNEANQLKDKVMPWHWENRKEGSLHAYVAFKRQEDALKKEFLEILSLLKGFSNETLSSEIALLEAAMESYLATLAALAAQSNGKNKRLGPFRRITEKELWEDRCKAYQYIM